MKQKPDWKDAPEWAQFLAWDAYGWGWYETRPVLRNGRLWHCFGKSAIAVSGKCDPTEILEERPQ